MEVEEFGALLERFERSALRVEARDSYDVEPEREEFGAFLEAKQRAPSLAVDFEQFVAELEP